LLRKLILLKKGISQGHLPRNSRKWIQIVGATLNARNVRFASIKKGQTHCEIKNNPLFKVGYFRMKKSQDHGTPSHTLPLFEKSGQKLCYKSISCFCEKKFCPVFQNWSGVGGKPTTLTFFFRLYPVAVANLVSSPISPIPLHLR